MLFWVLDTYLLFFLVLVSGLEFCFWSIGDGKGKRVYCGVDMDVLSMIHRDGWNGKTWTVIGVEAAT